MTCSRRSMPEFSTDATCGRCQPTAPAWPGSRPNRRSSNGCCHCRVAGGVATGSRLVAFAQLAILLALTSLVLSCRAAATQKEPAAPATSTPTWEQANED